MIVENRPGANGGLAAGDVVRSTPDGYTLYMAVVPIWWLTLLFIMIFPTTRFATFADQHLTRT